MNKNTLIGILLIGAILVGFFVYNSKVAKQQIEYKRVQDSLAMVRALDYAEQMAEQAQVSDTLSVNDAKSSARANVAGNNTYASTYRNVYLEEASKGVEEFFYLENENIRVKYSTKGAQADEVLIKDYTTSDSTDLYLMKSRASRFGLNFYTDQYVNTSEFCFTPYVSNDSLLIFRLPFSEDAYIEYNYFLPSDSYMVDFNVRMVGMDRIIPRNAAQFEVDWKMDIPRLEKGYKNEMSYSTMAYKYPGDKSVEDLGLRKESAKKNITTRLNWFAFQQQFFSAIMLADNNFESGNLEMKFYPETDPAKRLMVCSASTLVQYDPAGEVTIPFKFYFGPNRYKTLKSYDHGFEGIVPLGGWLVRWINVWVIIPIFNFFGRFISNYGIIILLLTLLIKLVISPLTFKSMMSSAKMNVIRPEIDKINARYPKPEDAMKKQQATMELYRKAGINMFGGCLPMLLQFPVLFAMFRFFPASIELRQQHFLWASDLSTFDSIWDFGVNIPLYGDHMSLFAILCALTMHFSARMTQPSSKDPQTKAMRNMSLYFMPIFMLFICNNLSSGLTYYYLLSNLFMVLQTWFIRRFLVDEAKIMARINAPEVKGAKPKSKFQQRLEAIQKAQEAALKEQQRKQQRR